MIRLKLIYNIIPKSSLKNLLFLMGGSALPPLPPHAPVAPQLPHSARLLIDLLWNKIIY
jgi:hypothetical protein